MDIETMVVLSLLLACFSGVLGLYGLLLRYAGRIGKIEGRLDAVCEKIDFITKGLIKQFPAIDPVNGEEDEDDD